MDLDYLLRTSDLIGSHGPILSQEEGIVLYHSLLLLQDENHFQRIFFWGRIYGSEKDYYVVWGYIKNALAGRVYYYSVDCINWGLLPQPTPTARLLSPICTTQFQGDPALVLDIMCEKDDATLKEAFPETANHVKQLKEEDRLAATVHQITAEAAVVPRGYLFKRYDGVVIENTCFTGLTMLEAQDLKYYFHFAVPKAKWEENMMVHADYRFDIDFLDSIEKDVPHGCWCFQSYAGEWVVLRSLYWPGMLFFHRLETPVHGFVYNGHGKKSLDIPFMLPTIDG